MECRVDVFDVCGFDGDEVSRLIAKGFLLRAGALGSSFGGAGFGFRDLAGGGSAGGGGVGGRIGEGGRVEAVFFLFLFVVVLVIGVEVVLR